jgi:nascent polypeptide-associated complex subunit alpha
MMPNMSGLDPRMLNSMMKKMGITNDTIDAKRVIIELSDKRIIIENPNVTEVSFSGQKTYQVMGEVHEEVKAIEIPDSDIELVMESTKLTKQEAKALLEKAEGDIAKAISLAEK